MSYEKPIVRDYGDVAELTAGIAGQAGQDDVGVKTNDVVVGGSK